LAVVDLSAFKGQGTWTRRKPEPVSWYSYRTCRVRCQGPWALPVAELLADASTCVECLCRLILDCPYDSRKSRLISLESGSISLLANKSSEMGEFINTRCQSKLFKPLKIANGKIELSHRVIHAPLTRNRGTPISESTPENPNRIWVPNDHVIRYYTQRATPGGLLISEGLPPSLEVLRRSPLLS
jgi:hypothetical protein